MLTNYSDGHTGSTLALSSTGGYQFLYLFFDASPESQDIPKALTIYFNVYCTGSGGAGQTRNAAIVNVDNVAISG